MLSIYLGNQKLGADQEKIQRTQEAMLESMQQKVETKKLNMTMFSPE